MSVTSEIYRDANPFQVRFWENVFFKDSQDLNNGHMSGVEGVSGCELLNQPLFFLTPPALPGVPEVWFPVRRTYSLSSLTTCILLSLCYNA